MVAWLCEIGISGHIFYSTRNQASVGLFHFNCFISASLIASLVVMRTNCLFKYTLKRGKDPLSSHGELEKSTMAFTPVCHPSVWVVRSPSDASMRRQIAVTVARPRLKSQLQKGVWQFLWPVGYHQRFVPNCFLAQKKRFCMGPAVAIFDFFLPLFFYRLTCQTKGLGTILSLVVEGEEKS